MMLWERFSDFLKSHNFFFFLGKGGTGKTTLSILLANFFKKDTLLLSLDPAHNISDYLNLKEKKERKKFKNIVIFEPDIEKRLYKKALESAKKIEGISPLYTIFEDLSLRENLKFLPGIEEEVLIEIIIESFNEKFEKIIFDMPPTGLSLRLISMILFRERMLKFLLNQRKKIIELRKIKGEKIEGDIVYEKIEENLKFYLDFLERFKKESLFFIVFNPDKSSILEGERFLKFLKKKNFKIKKILNRLKEKMDKNYDIFVPELENPLSFLE